ncbi:hypothetical protein D3C81_1178960 [compost metagenome]
MNDPFDPVGQLKGPRYICFTGNVVTLPPAFFQQILSRFSENDISGSFAKGGALNIKMD